MRSYDVISFEGGRADRVGTRRAYHVGQSRDVHIYKFAFEVEGASAVPGLHYNRYRRHLPVCRSNRLSGRPPFDCTRFQSMVGRSPVKACDALLGARSYSVCLKPKYIYEGVRIGKRPKEPRAQRSVVQPPSSPGLLLFDFSATVQSCQS